MPLRIKNHAISRFVSFTHTKVLQNLAGSDDTYLKAQKNMKKENFAFFTSSIFFFFKRVTNLSIMLSYETFFRLSNPPKTAPGL